MNYLVIPDQTRYLPVETMETAAYIIVVALFVAASVTVVLPRHDSRVRIYVRPEFGRFDRECSKTAWRNEGGQPRAAEKMLSSRT